jgi:hypothetical protein
MIARNWLPGSHTYRSRAVTPLPYRRPPQIHVAQVLGSRIKCCGARLVAPCPEGSAESGANAAHEGHAWKSPQPPVVAVAAPQAEAPTPKDRVEEDPSARLPSSRLCYPPQTSGNSTTLRPANGETGRKGSTVRPSAQAGSRTWRSGAERVG